MGGGVSSWLSLDVTRGGANGGNGCAVVGASKCPAPALPRRTGRGSNGTGQRAFGNRVVRVDSRVESQSHSQEEHRHDATVSPPEGKCRYRRRVVNGQHRGW